MRRSIHRIVAASAVLVTGAVLAARGGAPADDPPFAYSGSGTSLEYRSDADLETLLKGTAHDEHATPQLLGGVALPDGDVTTLSDTHLVAPDDIDIERHLGTSRSTVVGDPL